MVLCRRWRTTRRCRTRKNHVTRLPWPFTARPRHELFLRRTYHGEFLRKYASLSLRRNYEVAAPSALRALVSRISFLLLAVIPRSLSPRAETLPFTSKNKEPERHVHFFLKRITRERRAMFLRLTFTSFSLVVFFFFFFFFIILLR